MGRRRSVWAAVLGVMVAAAAFAGAPSGKRGKNDANKSAFLARIQAYRELAEEMVRLVDEKTGDDRFKQLAKQWKTDYLDANARLANYVLSRRVDLPGAVLEGEEKERFRVAMINVENLRYLNGAHFERSFANVASQLPGMTASELMAGRQAFADDQELLGVVDPFIAALDQHRKDAEVLARDVGGGPAAARRPPAQR